MLLGDNNLKKYILAIGIILLFFISSLMPIGFADGGLQDSAWPMFGHDAKHTGRSPYGPNIGNTPVVRWKFWMDGMTISSPAIDENGTIYIGAEDFHDSFFAIYPNGTEKWNFDVGAWVDSSPAIGADGTIYFGSMDSRLYALYPDGTKRWRTGLGDGWVKSSPVIDDNGIIYAASVGSSRLCALYPNGTIIWMFHANDYIYCSPAIDENGIVYIGSNDGYMYAIYSNNGTEKWKYHAGGTKGIGSAPTIGPDRTIYFGCTNGYLYALNQDGSLKWKFDTGWWIGGSSPAISDDGTIYVGTNDDKIFSIDPDGSENWHFDTDDEIMASPVIDKNGIVYCGDIDGYLYALNPDGTLRWRFDTDGSGIASSVAIAEDGTIYIAAQVDNYYTYLYALDVIYNEKPEKPSKPSGQTSGKTGTEYTYTTSTTDPENDDLYYDFNWGDGTSSGWLGPYNSGETISTDHAWTSQGDFNIKVRAKDTYDHISEWSDSLPVTMPRNRAVNNFFLKFIKQFPIIHQLLNCR